VDKLLAERFGIVLSDVRAQRQITQQELAFECELDRTFISLLERGLRQPSLSTIFAIAIALKLKPSAMIKAIESEI